MRITLQMLKDNHACRHQVWMFEKHFGQGGTVTLAKCKQVANIFNWDWAAAAVLPWDAKKKYHNLVQPARDQYNVAVAPARLQYAAVVQPLWNKCLEAMTKASARSKAPVGAVRYHHIASRARATYAKAVAPAKKRYNTALRAAIIPLSMAQAVAFYHATKVKGQRHG